MRKIQIIWGKWRNLAKRIAIYQSKFLLTFIYFFFISPLAIVFKFFSDSLNLKKPPHWLNRTKKESKIEQLRNQ